MVKLPQQLTLQMMQNRWATLIEPLINASIVDGNLLPNITLTIGNNSINHQLGRKLKGWIIVGINGIAEIYDTQATNQMPDLTINLTSDSNVSVSLWVF